MVDIVMRLARDNFNVRILNCQVRWKCCNVERCGFGMMFVLVR